DTARVKCHSVERRFEMKISFVVLAFILLCGMISGKKQAVECNFSFCYLMTILCALILHMVEMQL
uniref:hypothetical protein n=1 Tax=Acetatifactor sp. TaxID=1872090 RepID=UPI0040568951